MESQETKPGQSGLISSTQGDIAFAKPGALWRLYSASCNPRKDYLLPAAERGGCTISGSPQVHNLVCGLHNEGGFGWRTPSEAAGGSARLRCSQHYHMSTGPPGNTQAIRKSGKRLTAPRKSRATESRDATEQPVGARIFIFRTYWVIKVSHVPCPDPCVGISRDYGLRPYRLSWVVLNSF